MLILLFAVINMGVFAQTTVTGTVVDKTGEPLIGVSVLEKDTSTRCVTNIDGEFSLAVRNANDAVLQFSYIGMDSQEVALAGRTRIEVVMQESS